MRRRGRQTGAGSWFATPSIHGSSGCLSLDKSPWDGTFTPDGKWVVFRTAAMSGRRELMYAPTSGDDRTPRHLVQIPGSALTPAMSPDGRWVAFTTFDNGRYEVYASSFPGPGPMVKISVDVGLEPHWSADGRSIYYRGERVMRAADVSPVGQTLTVLGRRKVFDDPYILDAMVRNYDLSPDGKHFLMLHEVDQQVETIIVYNWASELRKSWR